MKYPKLNQPVTSSIESIDLLFPTPLYRNNIGVFDIGDYKSDRHRTIADDGYISNNEHYLEVNKELKKAIDGQVENYIRTYLNLKKTVYLKHQSSWLSVHDKGDFSPRHYHSNSWLSGVYYPIVNPMSGKFMVKARPPYGWCDGFMIPESEVEHFNDITSSTYSYSPQEGDLFLFPSHLDHESEPNQSDLDRVCVAFNYTLHGNWGSTTTFISIP